MNNNIVCYILTYNHPDTIRTYLEYCLDMYNACGVDICICDSSPNDDTQNIVESYMGSDKGLFYVRIDSDVPGDAKMLMALKRYGLEKEYQYVLPIKDRSLYTDSTWKIVQDYAREDVDLIFLEVCKHPDKYRYPMKNRYDDAREFFSDYGWTATSWETCIINTRILDALDWTEVEEKYNLGGNNNFNQPVTLFVALSQVEKPDIRVLFENEANQKGITGTGSMWRDVIFDLWAKRWPAAINSLPAMYDDYKAKVIFDQTDIRALFGWASYMTDLREKDVLTEAVWEWLRPIWPTLSSIPVEEMDLIVQKKYIDAIRLMKVRLDACFDMGDIEGVWKIVDQYENMAPNDLMIPLSAALMIDESEKKKNLSYGIFTEVYSTEQFLDKYNRIGCLIKEFEKDLTKEQGLEIYSQLQKNFVTGDCLSIILTLVCTDQEKAITNLESLWT